MKKQSKIKKPIYSIAVGSMLVAGLSSGVSVTAGQKNPKISINKSNITLKVGNSKTLKLKGISSKKIKEVKWKSTKKKIATVSSKGVVKAKKAGKCKIIATYSGKSYKCKVTVKKAFESTTEKNSYDPKDNEMNTLYGPPPEDSRTEEDTYNPSDNQNPEVYGPPPETPTPEAPATELPVEEPTDEGSSNIPEQNETTSIS